MKSCFLWSLGFQALHMPGEVYGAIWAVSFFAVELQILIRLFIGRAASRSQLKLDFSGELSLESMQLPRRLRGF